MIFFLSFVNMGHDLIGSVPLCSLKDLEALHPPPPPVSAGTGEAVCRDGMGSRKVRGGEDRPEGAGLTAGSLKATTPAGLGGSETSSEVRWGAGVVFLRLQRRWLGAG